MSVNSCRKDQNQTQLAAETNGARSWYMNQHTNQVSYLKSNAGDSVVLSNQPDWENATKISLEDQSTAYAIPVITNLYKMTGNRGSLMLMIKKTNNAYSSRLISIDAKKGSVDKKTRLANLDFSKICKQAFAEKDNTRLKVKNSSVLFSNNAANKLAIIYPGQTQTTPEPGKDVVARAITCVEWVLVTDYYVDGVWVSSTEQVVGITCSGSGGGPRDEGILPDYGGGGDPIVDDGTCDEALSNMTGMVTNESAGTTLVSSDANTRTQTYDWVIYKQKWGLWKFTSHEKGIHVFENNVWKWQSLVHESIDFNGTSLLQSINCSLNSATAYLGIYNSLMVINANITVSVVCQYGPLAGSDNFVSQKLINVND